MKWRPALSVLCAILAAGCTAKPAGVDQPVPAGVHLLADAQMYVAHSGANEVRTTYFVQVINGGDSTCSHAIWNVDWWPAELQRRIVRESTGEWGEIGVLKPGDRRRPYGETVFDTTGLAEPQVDQLLADLRVTVRCDAPAGSQSSMVIFELRKDPPPPAPHG